MTLQKLKRIKNELASLNDDIGSEQESWDLKVKEMELILAEAKTLVRRLEYVLPK